MMQDAKLSATGRKGEEAIDVDVSGMLVGDWLTIITGDAGEESPAEQIRLTKTGPGEFTIRAIPDYFDAKDGESYGQVGANSISSGELRFKVKRDPRADLAKAERGEFTS